MTRNVMGNNDIVPGFDNERDESLNIKLENVPGLEGCLTVTLNGRIDTDNSAYFQKHIQKLVEAGFMRLIFDCAGLDYVSSTGIGSFTSFLKLLKPRGGDLVLLEIQPKVFEVFQLLGFSQFFAIKKTLEEAIVFFNSEVKRDNPVLWKTC
jgi:anti-anti-sigma factor